MHTIGMMLPVLLFVLSAAALAIGLLVAANLLGPARQSAVKRMPYESGMDPIHDTRRRFDVRFHLLAVAFLVFDVELLFLYPWAVGVHASGQAVPPAVRTVADAVPVADPKVGAVSMADRSDIGRPPYLFAGGMLFIGLLALGLVYDWRKGIFEWR